MKRLSILFGILAATVLLVTACNPSSGSGVMEVSMTDAPLMEDDVEGVFITVEGIQYNNNDEGWNTLADFEGPQTFDLLALNSGNSRLLGEMSLPAGNYSQIRFMIGAPDEGEGAPTSPGSWIERGVDDAYGVYDSEVDSPLFVPSGAQTGYKAVYEGDDGEESYFTVPVNGSVAITADFDLRRAVVKRGSTGLYNLKPVLRIVVDNEAGMIAGDIVTETTSYDETSNYVVHAYESGAYDESESAEPVDEDAIRFANAVTSSELEVSDEYDYVLAYLAAGDYDLYIAEYVTNPDPEIDGYIYDNVTEIETNVSVTAGETTDYDLDGLTL